MWKTRDTCTFFRINFMTMWAMALSVLVVPGMLFLKSCTTCATYKSTTDAPCTSSESMQLLRTSEHGCQNACTSAVSHLTIGGLVGLVGLLSLLAPLKTTTSTTFTEA
jgi:hypothetical protein